MKIEKKIVKVYTLSELQALDPITLMVEDFGEGKCEVTIKCYGKSWTAYWGSMGGSLKEFFTRTNVHYLAGKFGTELELNQPQELNCTAMNEVFVEEVRQRCIERVKEGYTKYPSTRDVYDECVAVDLGRIKPQHPYDTWKMNDWSMTKSSWEEIFGDEDNFTEWMYENVPDVYEENYDYIYLLRIVEAVRDFVISEEYNND